MRRRLVWAACTAVAIVACSGGISTTTSARRLARIPIWADPAWWIAAGAAAAASGAIVAFGAPSVRRLLVASVASFVTYSVVGGALGSFVVLGVDWVSGTMWTMAVAVLGSGNAWAALIVPVALALLPWFKAAVVGSPVVWAHHRYGPADDDEAAEDFGIF